MKPNRKECRLLLNREPCYKEMTCSLEAISRLPSRLVKETAEVVSIARKFNEEVVRPAVLRLDRTMQADSGYLPYDFVEQANAWGFYTMWIPRIFGGKGYSPPTMAYFLEEIASACLGMANLIGVHYLGVASLAATLNTPLINFVFRETAKGEASGQPCLLSTAITEPGAGTDVEDVDLVDKGAVSCHAEKITGGYSVNGVKVFISSGHLSTWHILIAYTDLRKPSENMIMMTVKTGAKGFSFGRMEKKMGQKACPASELIFRDCFVPDHLVAFASTQNPLKTPARQVAGAILDDVLAASRAGVGAFGAGAARGAFETALAFASETEVRGKYLINHEWVQNMLADMYANAVTARLAYNEANYAIGLYGTSRDLLAKPAYYMNQYAPGWFIEKIMAPLVRKPFMMRLMQKERFEKTAVEERELCSGMGSLSKFRGTDLGIENCRLALSLMGQAGLRHEMLAEKMLRDVKLLQIYEGTNQLNRLNLFKCLIGRDCSERRMFSD